MLSIFSATHLSDLQNHGHKIMRSDSFTPFHALVIVRGSDHQSEVKFASIDGLFDGEPKIIKM
jgi:hypothetical protein